jgi:hypothetical protein
VACCVARSLTPCALGSCCKPLIFGVQVGPDLWYQALSMTKGRYLYLSGRRGIVSLALSGALLWACGGTLPPPNSSDVSTANSRWPGTTLEQLSSGRRAYLKKCGTCHSLKSESSVPREAWEQTVNRMRSKNGAELSDEEVANISRYLYAMGSR